MTAYHKLIEELIDKKLKLALDAIEKERKATAESYVQQKEEVKAEEQARLREAYADYAKAVDPTGVQAEELADKGLADTGKSQTVKQAQENVYQKALAALRAQADEAMAQLSQQEKKDMAKLEEADTKAQDNAYTLLMKEQQRFSQEQRKAAEAQIKAQATKKTTTTPKTSTGQSSYPTNGTDRQKYNWLKGKLEELVAGAKAGEKLVEVARPYLETAHKDLNDQYYLKLLDIVV